MADPKGRRTPAWHARHAVSPSKASAVQPAVRFDEQRLADRSRQQLFATVIRTAGDKKTPRIKVFNVGDVIKTKVNLSGAVFARDQRR